ncbi:MAG: HipA domain-containing protein [Coriobacteriales bacterium]|jgi:serine/threonine protein kinase HipA of HipAB toxin-antitoxin module|nr:HipA domain-containing protein [Coriobacteriales bacterium]
MIGRLCKQMTVNVVLSNTDAHAKNYSLLHILSNGGDRR